jgi:hypothetical protein
MRRLAALGSFIVAIAIPATTLAQTATSDPGEFDALAAVILMNEVPADIRASCLPGGPATAEGAVASAQCQNGDQLLLYVRFDDVASLEAGYDLVFGMSGLTRDSGKSCAEGPFEGEYTTADGAVGGRLACQVGAQASAIAAWTDVERLALALVEKPGAEDWAGLHAAWQEAQLVDATPLMEEPVSTQAPSQPEGSAPPPVDGAPPSTRPAADAGETLYQWASVATASSEYGNDSWGAVQATGPTDTTDYGDQTTAWAPQAQDAGMEWLELTYDTPVIPSEVVVYESSGNGFVTAVEVWDEAAQAWLTVWQGDDQSPEFVIGFSPDITPVDVPVDRVRVHIDTAVPGWNEVDAVALVGTVPPAS